MVAFESIEELCHRIVAAYKPERVVLFGSYARGTQNADSDVDLLVVMPFEGKSVNKSVEMRLRFRPPFPMDLLVRTPEAVKERLEIGDVLLRDIVKTGKVLYEADHV